MNYCKLLLITIIFLIIIICIIVTFLRKSDLFENYKTNKREIVLITEYFVHKNTLRFLEIKNSINKNVENKYIDKIYLMNENKNNKYDTNTNKIINLPSNKRGTFEDTFKIANTLPTGTIVIISNNDISFDDTLKKIYDVDLDNTVICLGRRSANNDNKLEFWTEKGLSHDSWIFKTPIRIPDGTDFYFGTTACDRHIAYLLDSVGYELINIPWDIKAYHNHSSEERKWVSKPDVFKGKFKIVPVMKNNEITNKTSLNKNGFFYKIYKILEYFT